MNESRHDGVTSHSADQSGSSDSDSGMTPTDALVFVGKEERTPQPHRPMPERFRIIPMDDVDCAGFEDLLRERFFEMVLKQEKILPGTPERLLSREPSGFAPNSQRKLDSGDRPAIERLLSYRERPAVSLRDSPTGSAGLSINEQAGSTPASATTTSSSRPLSSSPCSSGTSRSTGSPSAPTAPSPQPSATAPAGSRVLPPTIPLDSLSRARRNTLWSLTTALARRLSSRPSSLSVDHPRAHSCSKLSRSSLTRIVLVRILGIRDRE